MSVNVYTDYKNLTFNTLSAPRVMRWKMFLKQYSINLTYVPRKTNVLADCFSKLPRMDGPLPGKNEEKGMLIDFKTLVIPKDEKDVFMSTREELPMLLPSVCNNENVDIIELFMNLPALLEMTCPLTVSNIQQHQAGGQALVQTALVQFQNCPNKTINECNLVCYHEDPNVVNEDYWKIYIPQSMIQDVI